MFAARTGGCGFENTIKLIKEYSLYQYLLVATISTENAFLRFSKNLCLQMLNKNVYLPLSVDQFNWAHVAVVQRGLCQQRRVQLRGHRRHDLSHPHRDQENACNT